ncbi:MAG: Vms1/Ankzf1 family peptidyl-tRNA hydrolase [Thermodesulfovibrionales bacterium]|nr:Vms1/Ankzf1 family peptidyl-tRNA hydrolase [Thermodesulfovibrionales bacterium]
MLSRAELKEITSMERKGGYFVSLYLNVDPMFNKKGDYTVHLKNMMKNTVESLDKTIYKRVKDDLERIDNYVLTNKRMFKKGLALLSSTVNSFWKEYHLGIPVKNELIVDKTPYTKPLMDILDNYQRYAVLLVDKESARIFVVHLREIVEYGEVHTPDIPGKHKKGGWFALSQNHYARHIDYHVGMHLKEVIEKLDSFLGGEYIGRLIIGGSDEAVSMVKDMLHKTILDKVIGTVKIEMFAKSPEVLARVEPIVLDFEKKKEKETVEALITGAMKNKDAVLGLENVLNALQEQKVMKLVLIKDFRTSGYSCSSCGFLTIQKVEPCPYCKGEMEIVDYIVDLAGEKAIGQGALVEVVAENKKLLDAGGIGAFLRF